MLMPRDGVAPSRVRLRLAGAFGASRDGVELSDGQVGSRKSRTLLKLLAVERPGLVPIDRIVAVLWDDQPPVAAEQNVATLVSRLRAVLGSDAILGGKHAYQLAGDPLVSIDIDEAAQFCERAERNIAAAPAVALSAAERALALLAAGTALADEPYATWADPARDEMRTLLRRGRLAAARAALGTEDARPAMGYAQLAMIADALDEEAHRWYMTAAAVAGEPGKALAAFAALSERLSDELGADPAPQTRDLHLAILQEKRPHQTVEAGARRRPPQASAAPAGRDAEIEVLRQAWGSAAGGYAAVVMIVGEAGIGKTTLAEFIAAEAAADGATVLRTRCYETERSLFLQPIIEAVTPVLSTLPAPVVAGLLGEHVSAAAALLPAVAALLGPPQPWRGSVEMERRRAFEAMTALLRGLAERGPVLLLVDDLQNAGRSTLELLHYLGRHCAGARLLALITVRAENDPQIGPALAPVATRLELGPLRPEAVEQLARAAGQESLVDHILLQTGGHTLFVVEVLRALVDGDTGLPASLRSAISERVRRAGPAAEAMLRAAAVLGAAVDPLALATVLDMTLAAALELCDLALEARLLVASGRDYEFANDLVREILYATTPEPTRVAYHRRAADIFTGQPESLARHAAAAGDWPRAARAWLLAAENALSRYATADAEALATEALTAAESCDDAEVAGRAVFLRSQAREAAGRHEAALSDLNRGIELARTAGDRRLEMAVLRGLGGDTPASLGVPFGDNASNLEQGLRIAESLGDRAAEAGFLSILAIGASNRLRYDLALDYARRSLTVGRAASDDQVLLSGLDALKNVYWGLGELDALRPVLDELSPLVRRLGDVYTLQWLEFEGAFLSIAAADWEGAATAMRAGMEANRRSGYPHYTGWYWAHLGWLARLRGRDEEAVDHGRRALTLTQEYPNTWWHAAACALLGGTLLVTGDRAEAIELFERGLAVGERAGVEAYMLRCAAPLAAATGSRAMLTRAAELLDGAVLPEGGAWVQGDECYFSLARAWLRHDEPDRARAVLAPLLTVAERAPWIATHAAALAVDGQALIQLGRQEQAGAALESAAMLASRHGLPHVLHEANGALRRLT
jgi:DNA-binding SARP family transcriptional activator/tetratricopeptide (TPR) repeat protein